MDKTDKMRREKKKKKKKKKEPPVLFLHMQHASDAALVLVIQSVLLLHGIVKSGNGCCGRQICIRTDMCAGVCTYLYTHM